MEPPAAEESCSLSWASGEPIGPGSTLAMGDRRGPLTLRARDWARRYLTLELRHEGAHCGRLWLRFHAADEAMERIHVLLGLLPGVRSRISFDLGFLDGQRVFLRRHPGALKGVCFGRRIEPAEIERVTVELEDTGGDQSLTIGAARLGDVDRCRVEIAEPMVDELGQWRSRQWPGKTRDATDLIASLTGETGGSGFPAGWSRYGGSRAHRFRATGFFRLERDARRWWLVDPEGCGFWSAGLDCVRPGIDSALVPGTERLFSWLPTAEGASRIACGRRRIRTARRRRISASPTCGACMATTGRAGGRSSPRAACVAGASTPSPTGRTSACRGGRGCPT